MLDSDFLLEHIKLRLWSEDAASAAKWIKFANEPDRTAWIAITSIAAVVQFTNIKKLWKKMLMIPYKSERK